MSLIPDLLRIEDVDTRGQSLWGHRKVSDRLHVRIRARILRYHVQFSVSYTAEHKTTPFGVVTVFDEYPIISTSQPITCVDTVGCVLGEHLACKILASTISKGSARKTVMTIENRPVKNARRVCLFTAGHKSKLDIVGLIPQYKMLMIFLVLQHV